MKPAKRPPPRSKGARAGSLTIVGTGLRAALQTTPEARDAISRAERLFYLISDPLSERWIRSLNSRATSLASCYSRGRPRMAAYERMADRILASVRSGRRVCVAFYGHPGVFVLPAHETIRRARSEGFDARMLPGVSSEDCLFAELSIDPARSGCQSYEATDFLVYRRRFDPSSAVILWQVGVIGNLNYGARPIRSGLRALARRLARAYGRRHEVVLFEASVLPVLPSTIRSTTLERLPSTKVTGGMTLFVPPRSHSPDSQGLRSLGLRRSDLVVVPECWKPGA
ncbi:MAG TPA: SAM-dependent methyltransferase [Thermoplasmata archaeon]|nr:SAM-dependent methyltransferase [Thermoplasmata archaeon]